MANRALYPPIVDSQMKAFLAGDNCYVYFSLSKFNIDAKFKKVHISVVEQDTNKSCVNLSPDTSSNDKIRRYRSTGIIIDAPPISVSKKTDNSLENTEIEEEIIEAANAEGDAVVASEDNLYCVIIRNQDISPDGGSSSGWKAGRTYKVQLRLANAVYAGSDVGESKWLQDNANEFSEWSTVCIVKATDIVNYTIPAIQIDSANLKTPAYKSEKDDTILTLNASTLELFGSFNREDKSEYIKGFQFILYDLDDNVLENTGIIFMDSDKNKIDNFNYLSTVELEDQKIYKLSFKFETEHGYIDGFYLSKTDDGEIIDHRLKFVASQIIVESSRVTLITVDNDYSKMLEGVTSLSEEEDNGRIGLKFYMPSSEDKFSGNLCIRRTDSRSNYKVWTDIKIYVVTQEDINEIPIIYDYTIESGVWYKYGVQKISFIGERGILDQMSNPIMRNFNYSFLLGKNNKQLRLMFDNTMPNYKYQVIESKIDPINSVYPIVTRNAATRYKTFPINGLISFWMDDNNTFTSRKATYDVESDVAGIANSYQDYNTNNNIRQYDYIYERDFRDQVLDFLCDGEFKLFKSPTEGNVIVRLMDVNCVPNQSLDRMIYSFTSNAFEMAAPTMENYLKYGFYSPGTWAGEFKTFETKIGQVQLDIPIYTGKQFNILDYIYQKYDSKGQNCGGYLNTIGDIYCLKITFDSKPMRIWVSNNSERVLGYNFSYNEQLFTVFAPNNIFEFDEKIRFNPSVDTINILGDIGDDRQKDSKGNDRSITVSVTVDFLYEMEVTTWMGRKPTSQTARMVVGEFFQECKPGENIYSELYYKYRIEGENDFRRLNRIASVEIEANPGTVIFIRDDSDSRVMVDKFTIGLTGKLNLHDITNIIDLAYLGVRDADGNIDDTVRQDILVKYEAVVFEGTY